jgi:RNA polymerase sigma-70 factor, ECF subfamily
MVRNISSHVTVSQGRVSKREEQAKERGGEEAGLKLETLRCLPWLRREAFEQPAWLEAARRGEPWALEQFYEAHRPLVYRLCCRLLGAADEVEDAMQAVFVSAFRALPRFRGESSLQTWIYRLAVNEATRRRARTRETLPLTEEHPGAPDAGPGIVENVHVRQALARLRAEHRVILILRFWEGLSVEEIGGVLGISLPAVKMRLHRARKEFRGYYEEAE